MNTDRHLKNELSELAAERNARKIKELREGSIEKPIDWQQVRIQAAIAAMQGFCNSCHDSVIREIQENADKERSNVISFLAVRIADALVKELKGE